MKILYVEDDPGNVELTQRELRRSAPHFSVDVAATRQEALDLLEQQGEEYDLVLTDLRLPDGDGLSLLKHIRGRALPVAVVVITGRGDEETAVTVLKAGANDYIVKRDDYLARLPLTLESALHRYRADVMRLARPLRVLYAEHNPSDIDLTRRHLERYAPYITLEAIHTAPDVMARLGSEGTLGAYDVLLLDYRLPGMNALELLKKLQQQTSLDIPVVLVTGQGDADVATQALKLGASDYITKNTGYLYQLPSVLENAYHRTQLVREQEALWESEQRLRKIIEHMPVLLDAFDEKGVALFWNSECERVTGYTADEIVGNPHGMELLVPDRRVRVDILKHLQTLGNYYRDWEIDVTCKDGQVRTIAWSNISRDYPIPNWQSWGIGVDVTARKRAEADLKTYSAHLEEMVRERTAALQEAQEQLVRQEKLAVLGQLAGGVGHELRTPLATISNAVYYLNMTLPDAGQTTHEYLGIIETEVHNSERIIAELLDFARIDIVTTQTIHLSAIVEQVLKKQALPDTIRVTWDFSQDLPSIAADPRHLEQILEDLVINALQAMPQGGEIRLDATAHDGALRLRVTDTGCGMSPEHRSKVFEPLFTTKTRGIGLGLAICKKLVEANGGTILVESREGCGSTFMITLPIKESQA